MAIAKAEFCQAAQFDQPRIHDFRLYAITIDGRPRFFCRWCLRIVDKNGLEDTEI